MFLKKFKVLFLIATALSLNQCIAFPNRPKDEKNSSACWYASRVSCERRTFQWSCDRGRTCKDDWHVLDAKNECIPVWKCPGLCPPNSHFYSCKESLESPLIEVGLPLAEFKELCQPKCICDVAFESSSDGKECLPKEVNNDALNGLGQELNVYSGGMWAWMSRDFFDVDFPGVHRSPGTHMG